jgi:threonine dehydrogenase-like Zn-dependent dehydrogenase
VFEDREMSGEVQNVGEVEEGVFLMADRVMIGSHP